jgi:histidinol-phosphate aminotransferase
MIKTLVDEREQLTGQLFQIPIVEKIHPSDANFILVKVKDAVAVYEHLKNRGVIVRNRSNVILCEGCLRITVGTPEENQELVQHLQQYSNEAV